jgi:hypothetical protein
MGAKGTSGDHHKNVEARTNLLAAFQTRRGDKLITADFAFLGAVPALLVTIFMRHAQIDRFREGIAGGTSVSIPVYAYILEAKSGEMDVK